LFGAKSRLSVLWRVLPIAPVLLLSIIVSMADERLNPWLSVPEAQGGLVFIAHFPVQSFFITDEKKSFVDSVKWNGKSTFIHQIRLKPGDYSIRLDAGPLTALRVRVGAGLLTYLTFGQIKDLPGTYVAVSDKGNSNVSDFLEIASAEGIRDVFAATYVEPIGNVLVLSTEPVWPIPPQPTPPGRVPPSAPPLAPPASTR
jgi:hypothetical protein